MPENNTTDRRHEAQAALGGDKLAEREAGVEKRRKEAMLAMEGEKHKTRRELDELKERAEAEQIKKKTEDRAAAEANRAATIAKAAAARAAAETATLEAQASQRERIAEAEATTNQLKQGSPKLSSFRTIKTDMAKAVREQGLSLSKIASMQSRNMLDRPVTELAENRRGGLITAVIAVLLIAGGLGAWWWYGSRPAITDTTDVTIIAPENPILRADARKEVALNNFRTLSETYEGLALAANGKAEGDPTGIIEIYFTQNGAETTFANFRQTLGLTIPDNLTRHLRDNFLFGFYDGGESRSRFLILQTSFFDQAWSATFDWERYMVGDLSTLLQMPNDNRVTWSDRVIRNKDAREAKNETGETVLIYSFVDDQTILFARNENAFIEAYKRLIEQA